MYIQMFSSRKADLELGRTVSKENKEIPDVSSTPRLRNLGAVAAKQSENQTSGQFR